MPWLSYSHQFYSTSTSVWCQAQALVKCSKASSSSMLYYTNTPQPIAMRYARTSDKKVQWTMWGHIQIASLLLARGASTDWIREGHWVSYRRWSNVGLKMKSSPWKLSKWVHQHNLVIPEMNSNTGQWVYIKVWLATYSLSGLMKEARGKIPSITFWISMPGCWDQW